MAPATANYDLLVGLLQKKFRFKEKLGKATRYDYNKAAVAH